MKKGKIYPLVCSECKRKVKKKGYCDRCRKMFKRS